MIAQLRIIRTISKKQQQQQQSGASSLFRFGVQRRCWVKQISKIGVMPIFWLDFDKSVTACRKILQLEKKNGKREISNFKKKKQFVTCSCRSFSLQPSLQNFAMLQMSQTREENFKLQYQQSGQLEEEERKKVEIKVAFLFLDRLRS